MGKNAALQVLLKDLAHIGIGAVVVALPVKIASADLIKPGLLMLGHRLVDQRALWVARVVALGLDGDRCCVNKQYFTGAACR